MRVGIGYDVHRCVEGSGVVLGGVRIEADFRLEGHSDADVALHALCDALLGAAALGDIGHHFPSSDEAYAGISSLVLLERTGEKIRQSGFQVANVDLVIVAEQPRISGHVSRMRDAIASNLEISRDRVSVKATTNERVGPEGRREAISAHAVALLTNA